MVILSSKNDYGFGDGIQVSIFLNLIKMMDVYLGEQDPDIMYHNEHSNKTYLFKLSDLKAIDIIGHDFFEQYVVDFDQVFTTHPNTEAYWLISNSFDFVDKFTVFPRWNTIRVFEKLVETNVALSLKQKIGESIKFINSKVENLIPDNIDEMRLLLRSFKLHSSLGVDVNKKYSTQSDALFLGDFIHYNSDSGEFEPSDEGRKSIDYSYANYQGQKVPPTNHRIMFYSKACLDIGICLKPIRYGRGADLPVIKFGMRTGAPDNYYGTVSKGVITDALSWVLTEKSKVVLNILVDDLNESLREINEANLDPISKDVRKEALFRNLSTRLGYVLSVRPSFTVKLNKSFAVPASIDVQSGSIGFSPFVSSNENVVVSALIPIDIEEDNVELQIEDESGSLFDFPIGLNIEENHIHQHDNFSESESSHTKRIYSRILFEKGGYYKVRFKSGDDLTQEILPEEITLIVQELSLNENNCLTISAPATETKSMELDVAKYNCIQLTKGDEPYKVSLLSDDTIKTYVIEKNLEIDLYGEKLLNITFEKNIFQSIFILDEATHDQNNVTLRIKIKEIPLKKQSIRIPLLIKNVSIIELKKYYGPNANVELVNVSGNRYDLVVTYGDIKEIWQSEIVIGIHNKNWQPIQVFRENMESFDSSFNEYLF